MLAKPGPVSRRGWVAGQLRLPQRDIRCGTHAPEAAASGESCASREAGSRPHLCTSLVPDTARLELSGEHAGVLLSILPCAAAAMCVDMGRGGASLQKRYVEDSWSPMRLPAERRQMKLLARTALGVGSQRCTAVRRDRRCTRHSKA